MRESLLYLSQSLTNHSSQNLLHCKHILFEGRTGLFVLHLEHTYDRFIYPHLTSVVIYSLSLYVTIVTIMTNIIKKQMFI